MVVDDSPIHLDGLDDSHRSLFFDQLLPAVDGVDPMGGVCRYWDECGKFWCVPTHSAVARPIAGQTGEGNASNRYFQSRVKLFEN